MPEIKLHVFFVYLFKHIPALTLGISNAIYMMLINMGNCWSNDDIIFFNLVQIRRNLSSFLFTKVCFIVLVWFKCYFLTIYSVKSRLSVQHFYILMKQQLNCEARWFGLATRTSDTRGFNPEFYQLCWPV